MFLRPDKCQGDECQATNLLVLVTGQVPGRQVPGQTTARQTSARPDNCQNRQLPDQTSARRTSARPDKCQEDRCQAVVLVLLALVKG